METLATGKVVHTNCISFGRLFSIQIWATRSVILLGVAAIQVSSSRFSWQTKVAIGGAFLCTRLSFAMRFQGARP